MKQEDFRCMRNGLFISPLQADDQAWIRGIEHQKTEKEHAILLLHGFASTPAVYRRFYPRLLERFDGVFSPLLPGHGESTDVFESASSAQWVACAENTCAALCQMYKKVDVVGLSMGGLLALHLSQHFQLNHLYLLAPALHLHMRLPFILSTLKCLSKLGFKRLRSKGGNINSHVYCEMTYRQLPIPVVIELLSFIQSFSFTMPHCPTDLFLGCDDQVVNSSKVAAQFSSQQQVVTHFLPNSAHVLPLDLDLDVILECMVVKKQP